jgi:hypothetical protein
MDEYTIRQAIDLIRARRYSDARKLLRPVLEVNPTNEAAWVWFASTYSGPTEKMQVYQAARIFCPESDGIVKGIEKCEDEVKEMRLKGEEPSPVDITEELPQNAREQKKKSNVQALPEPGQPFEWNQPLTYDRRGTTSYLPPLQEPQVESAPAPAPTPAAAPHVEEPPSSEWMDSLRGTMTGEDSRPVDQTEDRRPFSLDFKPSAQQGESEGETGTIESIARTVKNIWDKMGDEETQPEEPGSSFTNKLQQFWDKLGITDKSAKQADQPAQTVQPAFIQSDETSEQDVNYHPEFFQTPQPEAEPQPFIEPVVVWGAQTADSVPQEQQYPWHYPGDEPAFTPPAPTPQQDEKPAETSVPVDEVNDPYKNPFNFALALAILLGILIVLIAAFNYLL